MSSAGPIQPQPTTHSVAPTRLLAAIMRGAALVLMPAGSSVLVWLAIPGFRTGRLSDGGRIVGMGLALIVLFTVWNSTPFVVNAVRPAGRRVLKHANAWVRAGDHEARRRWRTLLAGGGAALLMGVFVSGTAGVIVAVAILASLGIHVATSLPTRRLRSDSASALRQACMLMAIAFALRCVTWLAPWIAGWLGVRLPQTPFAVGRSLLSCVSVILIALMLLALRRIDRVRDSWIVRLTTWAVVLWTVYVVPAIALGGAATAIALGGAIPDPDTLVRRLYELLTPVLRWVPFALLIAISVGAVLWRVNRSYKRPFVPSRLLLGLIVAHAVPAAIGAAVGYAYQLRFIRPSPGHWTMTLELASIFVRIAAYLATLATLLVVYRRVDRIVDDDTLCRMCGYDLQSLEGERCPECGTSIQPGQAERLSAGASKSDRRGTSTRRRVPALLFAGFVAAALTTVLLPNAAGMTASGAVLTSVGLYVATCPRAGTHRSRSVAAARQVCLLLICAFTVPTLVMSSALLTHLVGFGYPLNLLVLASSFGTIIHFVLLVLALIAVRQVDRLRTSRLVRLSTWVVTCWAASTLFMESVRAALTVQPRLADLPDSAVIPVMIAANAGPALAVISALLLGAVLYKANRSFALRFVPSVLVVAIVTLHVVPYLAEAARRYAYLALSWKNPPGTPIWVYAGLQVTGYVKLIAFVAATAAMLAAWRRIDRIVNDTLCDTCGYELRGIDAPRCPECGTARGAVA